MPAIHRDLATALNNALAHVRANASDKARQVLEELVARVDGATGLPRPADVPPAELDLEATINEARTCIRNDDLTGARLLCLSALGSSSSSSSSTATEAKHKKRGRKSTTATEEDAGD